MSKRRSPQEMKEDLRAVAYRITPRSAFRVVEAIITSAILYLAGILTAIVVAGFVSGFDDGAMFITGMLGFILAMVAFIRPPVEPAAILGVTPATRM